jgi:hypothetical protein
MGIAVGQVVVCIDASGLPSTVGTLPKEGGVYTVREVRPFNGTVGLLLAEIINPHFEWIDGNVGEVAFAARRFRPAKATSLDVLGEVAFAARRFRPAKATSLDVLTGLLANELEHS